MAGQINKIRYKDLDLDFTPHPVTGDVIQKNNKAAVKQALVNLCKMGPYDKPFQPQINSRIRSMLFEPDTPLTKVEIRKAIFDIIKRYEPRVKLLNVKVHFNEPDNSYQITIQYQIINQPTVETLDLQMERLR